MSRLGRRLAFDYGDVRIGVAVCDPDGILATPLITLASKDPQLIKNILSLVEEYHPVKIYVGNPKLLSGNEGEAVAKVKAFKVLLEASVAIPIALIDERLSTVSASKSMRSAGISAKEARLTIDQMAAVAILEQGLSHDRE